MKRAVAKLLNVWDELDQIGTGILTSVLATSYGALYRQTL